MLGRDFTDNALRIDAEREALRLTGFAALPTYSRGAAVEQFLYVNGRPVRDKLLFGALQAAYADVLTRGRYPGGGAVPRLRSANWSMSTSTRPRPRSGSAIPPRRAR